jgi:hypothetical protein
MAARSQDLRREHAKTVLQGAEAPEAEGVVSVGFHDAAEAKSRRTRRASEAQVVVANEGSLGDVMHDAKALSIIPRNGSTSG